MSHSCFYEFETGEMERVFVTPVDAVAGHLRCLHIDPFNYDDTADHILEAFDEMNVWGTT